jgi:hypothetical protein
MKATATTKTNNRQIEVAWDSVGDQRDFKIWHEILSWVRKNENVLNRKTMDMGCKLLREQFPDVTRVSIKDFAGRGYEQP